MEIPLYHINNEGANNLEWIQSLIQRDLEKVEPVIDGRQIQKLNPLLNKWDSQGDNIIKDLFFKKGANVGLVSLENYLTNKILPTSEAILWQEYFSNITLEPIWLDKNKIKIASDFFRRTGVNSLIVLRDYCLIGSFLTPRLYKSLFYKGNIKDNLSRLIADNLEFWIQVTRENGLGLGKDGLTQLFRRRMNCSYQRIKLLKETNSDTEKSEISYNIGDQLATNIVFSLHYIIGLRKIGIEVSNDQNVAIFHFWKYVGYLIGIPLELLPNTEEEAIQSFYLWASNSPYPDEQSKKLAQILLDEPLNFPYHKDEFSRKFMREIHLFYNHFFLNEKICQQLSLPKTKLGKFALAHIWQTKKSERNIKNDRNLSDAILFGAQEQESILNIYRKYYS